MAGMNTYRTGNEHVGTHRKVTEGNNVVGGYGSELQKRHMAGMAWEWFSQTQTQCGVWVGKSGAAAGVVGVA